MSSPHGSTPRVALPLLALAALLSVAPPVAAADASASSESNDEVSSEPASSEAAAPARPAPPKGAKIYTLNEEERSLLHEMLSSGGAFKARIQAALILGRRGDVVHDLPILERALTDDDHYAVRGAAAMAIGNLGEASGISPLLAGLGDEDPFVRRACRKALFKLASTPRAIPYLLLARERPQANARMVAVELLGGMDAPDARHALASFLGDPDAPVRDAVERVIRVWPREEQVGAVLDALRSDSFRVRTHAARMAGPLQDGRTLMPLARLFASPIEPEEVLAAAEASLQEMRGLIDVEDHLKRVLGLVDRDARIPSIVLLGFAGSPAAVSALRRAAADPDVRIRFYAVRALGRAGDPSTRSLLEAMARDPANKRIQGAIRAALRSLGA